MKKKSLEFLYSPKTETLAYFIKKSKYFYILLKQKFWITIQKKFLHFLETEILAHSTKEV